MKNGLTLGLIIAASYIAGVLSVIGIRERIDESEAYNLGYARSAYDEASYMVETAYRNLVAPNDDTMDWKYWVHYDMELDILKMAVMEEQAEFWPSELMIKLSEQSGYKSWSDQQSLKWRKIYDMKRAYGFVSNDMETQQMIMDYLDKKIK